MAIALQYEQVAAYAPMTLYLPQLTEEEFLEWGERFSDFQLEYTADGELMIIPGTSMETGGRNAEVSRQLGNWARNDGRGRAYDSSTSFLLPNGARRSPDAAWVSTSRRAAAKRPGQQFPVLAPDFVIELKSPSDRLRKLSVKMEEWIENGVQLAWLIDPERRAITIYRPGREPETLLNLSQAEGEGPVAGFILELAPVWAIE
ncbi:MAG: Uma2 family endonuclease [Bryobacterales bacterium]|nr:Uma2 family endonuclease [Bryobacterales bacterium]